jgi:hypothetical protein
VRNQDPTGTLSRIVMLRFMCVKVRHRVQAAGCAETRFCDDLRVRRQRASPLNICRTAATMPLTNDELSHRRIEVLDHPGI